MKGSLPFTLSLLSLFLVNGCQQDDEGAPPASETQAQGGTEASSASQSPAGEAPLDQGAIDQELDPLPGVEAPTLTEKTTVRFETTAGNLVIEVYPQAAPNAAQRFLDLVEAGYYDETPVSRVVPGFVAQFGINWREGQKEWQERVFDDDTTLFSLDRGTLAFAKAGPDTNSTQVFINYRQNNQLAAPQYNFTVFGKVVEGMDVVDGFAQVGDPSGGLDQARLWQEGEAYLASLDEQPTMIEDAEVIDR